MPISFIICGLFLIYLLFDRDFKNRWIYVLLLSVIMVGFFIPSIGFGVYIVNPLLFVVPIVMALLCSRGFKTRDWAWMFTVIFITLVEYMFAVKVNNNLSLTISSTLLVLIVINSLFVPRKIVFPFIVICQGLIQVVSGVFENANQINCILGGVEAMNFMVLTVVVYGMINFAIQSIGRRKCEGNC